MTEVLGGGEAIFLHRRLQSWAICRHMALTGEADHFIGKTGRSRPRKKDAVGVHLVKLTVSVHELFLKLRRKLMEHLFDNFLLEAALSHPAGGSRAVDDRNVTLCTSSTML